MNYGTSVKTDRYGSAKFVAGAGPVVDSKDAGFRFSANTLAFPGGTTLSGGAGSSLVLNLAPNICDADILGLCQAYKMPGGVNYAIQGGQRHQWGGPYLGDFQHTWVNSLRSKTHFFQGECPGATKLPNPPPRPFENCPELYEEALASCPSNDGLGKFFREGCISDIGLNCEIQPWKDDAANALQGLQDAWDKFGSMIPDGYTPRCDMTDQMKDGYVPVLDYNDDDATDDIPNDRESIKKGFRKPIAFFIGFEKLNALKPTAVRACLKQSNILGNRPWCHDVTVHWNSGGCSLPEFNNDWGRAVAWIAGGCAGLGVGTELQPVKGLTKWTCPAQRGAGYAGKLCSWGGCDCAWHSYGNGVTFTPFSTGDEINWWKYKRSCGNSEGTPDTLQVFVKPGN